jgi:tetratricopeptide (TPR) repeat protein
MTSKPNRIEGWKAIAAHFKRDRTTVMRWARDLELPVRRIPGGGRSSVFAYINELDIWIASARLSDAEPEKSLAGSVAPPAASLPEPLPLPGEPAAIVVDQTRELAPVVSWISAKRVPGNRPMVWMAVGGMLVAGGLALAAQQWSIPPATGSDRTLLPDDPAVAAMFVQAREDWALRTAGSLHRAVAGFGKVVANDPDFAPGYAGLADAYLLIREFDAMPESQAYAKAEAAAKASLAIDAKLADPYRALGFINCWWHHDNTAAGKHFARALELDPRNAQTHFWFGNCLVNNGEIKPGLDYLNSARLLNPGSAAIKADYGWALWLSGARAEAKAMLTAQSISQPELVGPHTYLAYILMYEGDFAGYLTAMKRRAEQREDPEMLAAHSRLQAVYKRGGERALITVMMRDAAADRANGLATSSIMLANWAAATGNRAELMTILIDSDQRKQHWTLGGFADLAESQFQNDVQLARLVDRRRSASLLTR